MRGDYSIVTRAGGSPSTGFQVQYTDMLEFDRSPWINIHPDLSLYRYQGAVGRPLKAHTPVLMLHGPMTSHRTWDTLGDFLWRHGFDDIFAVDIADVQMGGSLRNALAHLGEVV